MVCFHYFLFVNLLWFWKISYCCLCSLVYIQCILQVYFSQFFFIFVQPIICIYVKYNDFMCKLSEKHILLERRTLSDWSAILIFLFVCQFWVIFFYFCLHFGGTYIRRVLLISYVPCYIFCFVFIFLIPLNQLYAFTYYNKWMCCFWSSCIIAQIQGITRFGRWRDSWKNATH